MHLTRLSPVGFRNLADVPLDFPPEGVALIGRNAQGKTNLLEAIHYLEMLRSFRRARDEELVCFGGHYFRVTAELLDERGSSTAITVAFRLSPRTKRVERMGQEVPRLGDAIGSLATVLFTPDDIALVRGGPAVRRRYLDLVLSLNQPGYLRSLQTFRHALAQRNAALRDRQGGVAVAAWDSILVESGALVSWQRSQWVDEFAKTFDERYREIAPETSAALRYEPSIDSDGALTAAEDVAEQYREALLTTRAQETRRRMTQVGPHRDDLIFTAKGSDGERDLKNYGSGGEQRTAALALRLLEVETARARREREPILLLDDVFAELDEQRSMRVLELLDRDIHGQVILTAPKESDMRFRGDALPRWTIEGGEVGS